MIWGRADVIIVEIKITTNIMCLNYPKPSPSQGLWKIFLPQNQSLVPQRLGTSALYNIWYCLYHIEWVITSLALNKRSLLYQSVSQFSGSVVSNSLWPQGLQHSRPPRPSPTPGVYSDSCPLSQWCHPPSHPLSSPSPPALNLSQHQGLFKWVRSPHP